MKYFYLINRFSRLQETLEKVDNWMNKYDKDMENIDLKIQIKKNDYQNMLDKRNRLEETVVKLSSISKVLKNIKSL